MPVRQDWFPFRYILNVTTGYNSSNCLHCKGCLQDSEKAVIPLIRGHGLFVMARLRWLGKRPKASRLSGLHWGASGDGLHFKTS